MAELPASVRLTPPPPATSARLLRAWSGKVGTGFPRRSCSNKKIERNDDSKKSHPALACFRAKHALGLDPGVDTGSREENTSKQQDRASVLIESEPKGLIQPQGCTIR